MFIMNGDEAKAPSLSRGVATALAGRHLRHNNKPRRGLRQGTWIQVCPFGTGLPVADVAPSRI